MKTAKLTIGIVSIVLFALIAFQSCTAGIVNILSDNGEISGSAGMFVALCMLVAGIVGICTRNNESGGYVAGAFYILGGLIGISSFGSFSDLKIWSILSFIFAVVFILGSMYSKKKDDDTIDEQDQEEFEDITEQNPSKTEKKINIWSIIIPILAIIAIIVWWPAIKYGLNWLVDYVLNQYL